MTPVFSAVTYNDGDNRTTRPDEIIAVLKDLDADVFGLQEAAQKHIEEYSNAFATYGCVYYENDGTTYNSQPIFYKKDKFSLVESGIKWLCDTPDKQFSKYPESAYIRSCTYALLRENESGKEVLAVNTHIDYTAVGNQKQVKRIIELIGERFAGVPAFVMGDWNMRRTSVGYALLNENGYVATEEQVEGAVKSGTCVDEDKTIDFVFVNKEYLFGVGYRVVNDHKYSKTASDHFPVYTEIAFAEK